MRKTIHSLLKLKHIIFNWKNFLRVIWRWLYMNNVDCKGMYFWGGSWKLLHSKYIALGYYYFLLEVTRYFSFRLNDWENLAYHLWTSTSINYHIFLSWLGKSKYENIHYTVYEFRLTKENKFAIIIRRIFKPSSKMYSDFNNEWM